MEVAKAKPSRLPEYSYATPAAMDRILEETLRKECRASFVQRHEQQRAVTALASTRCEPAQHCEQRAATAQQRYRRSSSTPSAIYLCGPRMPGSKCDNIDLMRRELKSAGSSSSLDSWRRPSLEWCPRNPVGGGPAAGAYWTGSFFGRGNGRYGRTPQMHPAEYGDPPDSKSYVTLMSDRTSGRTIFTREKRNAPWPPPNIGLGTLQRAWAEQWPVPSISQTMSLNRDMMAEDAKTNPYKSWTELSH